MHIHTSELLTTKWQSDCVAVNLGVKWQRDYDNPFYFLLWFRNLSDWFQNLPFVLLFRRFLNSIHILSEMERNLWSFLNRLSFYLILLNFFERIKERHSTKQKKTMSRTRCKNPLFYAPNARLEKEKKKERMKDRWNWNGIRDSEKEKERKRDGWKLIYDSRSGFFLRRSRHRDRSPVDWWMITQSSRSTRQRQSPPPPTWLSHRWICRVVGRDQVWNEEFGTALIAAIHTGLRTGLTHVVERTGGRTQQAQSFKPVSDVSTDFFLFPLCFRFIAAVNCPIHKFELMTFHIPFIWNTSFTWFWVTFNYLYTFYGCGYLAVVSLAWTR